MSNVQIMNECEALMQYYRFSPQHTMVAPRTHFKSLKNHIQDVSDRVSGPIIERLTHRGTYKGEYTEDEVANVYFINHWQRMIRRPKRIRGRGELPQDIQMNLILIANLDDADDNIAAIPRTKWTIQRILHTVNRINMSTHRRNERMYTQDTRIPRGLDQHR